MKIKYLVSFAGPNGVRDAGTVHETGQSEAIRLIEAGYAVAAEPDKPERAVARRTSVEKRG